eukprot:TRINITY_DN2903_c0_g1_i1.p1 TRINITY_DN2903_c0_g1~~TRINITY_DN2903_c0_g1_i1.p1  ORF type:complete len:620 (+),score=156.83 TRINITY_DN2903_c0_g1_i1:1947-3806(+)
MAAVEDEFSKMHLDDPGRSTSGSMIGTPVAGKKTFKVYLPKKSGTVAVDYSQYLTLQDVLDMVCKKRRLDQKDGYGFTYDETEKPPKLVPINTFLKDISRPIILTGGPEIKDEVDTSISINTGMSSSRDTKSKPGRRDSQTEHSPKSNEKLSTRFSSFFTDKLGPKRKSEMPETSMIPLNIKTFNGAGWLTKEGGRIKTWRRRWMVVKSKTMYYAKKQNSIELGVIVLEGLSKDQIQPVDDYKKRQHLFSVTTAKRTFYLQADSAEDRNTWVQFLQKIVGSKDPKHLKYDDFEVLALVGKGNFGKVLQVRQKGTHQIFAMKVLDKQSIIDNEELEHTMSEKNILQTLVHPFLVQLYFAFQSIDKLFLVMDFINGGDMFYHLQRERSFPPARAQFYVAQIVCGLEYLHSAGIIYRDLKAENLILNDDGYIIMTDFGISKQGLTDVDSKATTFCGTPEYLAPEILGTNGYTKAVDWWALGILLYEMLTGNPPFYAQNVQMMYSRIVNAQLTFPANHSSFDSDTKSMCIGLLQRDPNDRFTDPAKIKAHPYFKNIDFDKMLQKQLKPPYIPPVKDKTDVSMVDPSFTRESIRLTMKGDINEESQKHFEDFQFSRDGEQFADF